ncbi:TY-Chap2 family putative peptide chaperone [Brevibacterium linens]|nr:hypothetical protein [Brevibacterium linens]KAB1950061.1 hypothetical protein F8227_01505 [Brevibacterium linens ATCC 9172]
MNVRERMVFLQSWWVASELIRRHPELELIETHPGGGLYDCLSVLSNEGSAKLDIDLNRNGRIHIHSATPSWFDSTRWDIRHPVEWSTELEQEDRRRIPRFLEDAAGLRPPSQTPVTTSKTLTCRAIYHLLLFALNEAEYWDIRNGKLDSSGMYSDSERPYFEGIESAQIALRQSRPLGWKANVPRYDFWGVLRDGKCLGLLQIDGTLHRPNAEPVNLMKIYNANKRDILPTAMEVRKLLTS